MLTVMSARAASQDRTGPYEAVVQVEGCSGVCLDPSGLVLTAKHCDLREVERIQFGNVEVLAVRIYESSLTEGPLVYDCVGGAYPSVPVAHNPPDAGEHVNSLGFPLIESHRVFREEAGTVLRGGDLDAARLKGSFGHHRR